MNLSLMSRTTIKQTTSLCPECKVQIPAEVYESGGKVYLLKHCPDHGKFDVLINSDRRFYYDSCGAGSACQCAPGHSDEIVEKSATCIALIEIVESCNLKCPTCYASSPFAERDQIKSLSIEEFRRRIDAVIDRKGPLDILQLSGGEPTIHPQFFELLENVLQDQRIGYTLLNTNGVLLARDDAFLARLAAMHQRYRKFEVYLQFDGTQPDGQAELRGADLRSVRRDAITRTGAHGIPTTLAMTITQDNVHNLGDTLRFAVGTDSVRGITFQPMFRSGRSHIPLNAPTHRLNVADIVLELIRQSDGLLGEKDFTPLPCGDPNCHTIGYLLRRGGEIQPVSHYIDFSEVQDFLRDRVDFNIEDLARCGCENEPLGHILKALEIGPDNVFRLFIKPFMDVWTYDQDRIDRCCVHVVGVDGKLESFCRHYALNS